jgi:hypothetical protein
MNYETSEGDSGFDFDYIANEKQFTKEEFGKVCKESFDNCHNEQSNYFVKLYLKEKYGFKELLLEAKFEFEEK